MGDGSGLDATGTTPAATRQKVAWIRQAAGERFNQLELNMIMYEVVITEDRHQIARLLAGRFKTTDDQVLTLPHCLIGTLDQISEDLQTLREQYGISYIAVFDKHSETFAPVIARLAGSLCVMEACNCEINGYYHPFFELGNAHVIQHTPFSVQLYKTN